MSKDNLVLVWALAHYLSPLIFFVLSKLAKEKSESRTLIKNYFSYFIAFQCAFIVLARLVFREENQPLLEFTNLLFVGLPLITLIIFLSKKDTFIWFYFAFSISTVIYYVLNTFEPNASLSKNLNVIIEHLLILIMYFWYLNKIFKPEVGYSFKAFKFWLLDFDKKEAFWSLSPFIAILLVGIVVMIIIAIKFRNVIFARMF